MSYTSLNPATGHVIATMSCQGPDAVEDALVRATATYAIHQYDSFATRGALFEELAELLERRLEALAALIVSEVGKPIRQARGEVRKCASACRYYAAHAEAFLANETVATEARTSYVAFDPLGTILAIMPWNFPFWQLFRFAAPALMAGNVAILKHATNVPRCADAIAGLFRDAGFPAGFMQNLYVEHEAVEALIADPRIQAVTLTGSSRAGRSVAALAGQALKKVVLELGGSDAFIVLADADLEAAVEAAVASRMQNNGQSCIAAKRFILDRSIADAFLEAFVARVEALQVGDPMAETTDIGPMARADLRDTLHEQVLRTVQEGGRLITGGKALAGPGFYYAPTVIGDVEPEMTAFQEELFGPVAAVSVVQDVDEAIYFANRSRFGLGGTLFTRDRARGEMLARQLQAGCTFVNAMVRSDPRLPFGGVKESGIGRELSHFGMREFVNIKSVWVE
ncbi:MAG: NAD-dependent succinate-semialdehyde dehydrogenase [Rhodothermales bacterium]|nr:NAD-dependent succinate-semialdehyde dehydrogenase [Rhodothermales bacterium]